MPYNLLIFPLIGGYFFITHVYFLKFFHQRIERQRLIFNSILAGILLLFLSFVIVLITSELFPSISVFFNSLTSGFETKYLGTTITSLLIGIISPFIINFFLSEEAFIYDSIDKRGTQLEKLLVKSFIDEKYVGLTLKNGKVYIGIATLPKPGQEYFSLLPFYSGFRKEDHSLILDTQYIDVYDSLESFDNLSKQDLYVVIKKDEILTARMHNDSVYSFLNA